MYETKQLNLNAIVPETVLVENGRSIVELFVLDMPVGNQFKIRLGQNPSFITISKPFAMEPLGENDANRGMTWKNDIAQPGVIVELILIYGDRVQAVI